MSKIKNLFLSIMMLLSFAAPLTLAPVAMAAAPDADVKTNLCAGANLDVTKKVCKDDAVGTSVNDLIANVINIISVIVGVVAVIMIIIGGFRYITSGGDSNSVTGAKNTILYAIVGLIIVALAQVIVRFVLNKVS